MRYVWDPIVRICHWTLVVSFAVAFMTHESEWQRLTHVNAGYVAATVIFIRIIWGFLNTGYAKFQSFPPDPERALRYTFKIFRGKAKPFVGHNPAGSLVIYLMLGAGIMTVSSGFLVYNDGWLWNNPAYLQDLHFYSAWSWLILIASHITGVLIESLLHRENLILAMITGKKHDIQNSIEPANRNDVSRETKRIFAIEGFLKRLLMKLFRR
jgi:cytochrome b